MIRAMVFDFNGVIADDETPHVLCFQQALREAGLNLSTKEYYDVYLGMDERTCARLLLEERDGACDEAELRRITERKAELFRAHTARRKPPLFPGVEDFVTRAKRYFPLAIASGGRKRQIEEALSRTSIEFHFDVIVSAEDCAIGKPGPDIYLMTWNRLNALAAEAANISPAECLVVEDSIAGIRAAKAAGMRVLAIASTYPIDKLQEADSVVRSLDGLTPAAALERLG